MGAGLLKDRFAEVMTEPRTRDVTVGNLPDGVDLTTKRVLEKRDLGLPSREHRPQRISGQS
jgi:hypothetical protein